MTETTFVEWHPDRPFVHFGSPSSVKYWDGSETPPDKPSEKPKPVKKTKKKTKKGKK